ncbi:50S ribosomal protein L23 [Patescibacteria group bacterium]|nr:50S ribosomal protein L23 [Patescibacteria group bacterium]
MGLLDTISKKDKKTAKPVKKAKKSASKKATSKSSKKVKKVRVHSSANRVLNKPLVSEKAACMETEGKYVFSVAKDASKSDVKRAVSALYNVTPVKVNVVNVLGNKSRSGHKMRKSSTYKKAIVTLAQGEKIQLYEGV